jgi:uncharacterized protein with HEPN domain
MRQNIQLPDSQVALHILVHGYYQIKDERIWAAVLNELPLLQPQVKKMYESLS